MTVSPCLARPSSRRKPLLRQPFGIDMSFNDFASALQANVGLCGNCRRSWRLAGSFDDRAALARGPRGGAFRLRRSIG